MSLDEAMAGRGTPLTFHQARRELAAHGIDCEPSEDGRAVVVFSEGASERVPLNSRALLEWLGY